MKRTFFIEEEYDNYSTGNTIIYDNKANKFTFRVLIISVGIFALMWILNVLNIFIVDNRIMDMGLVAILILTFITLAYVRIFGYEKRMTKYVLVTMGLAIYGCMIGLLTYHATMTIVVPLVCSVQYRNRNLLLYTYVLTLITVATAVLWGFKNGLCDANMLLLTRTYSDLHVAQYLAGQFEINTDYMNIFMFFVVPRWLIISGFIPLLNHITEAIKNQTINELTARKKAEYDEMTDLYNKNKYLALVEEYYPKLVKVGVIYWDLNGLKYVNDNMGHEYGDQLIKLMADSIKGVHSYRHRCFRIGGDEFIMIVDDPAFDELEKLVKQWEERIKGIKVQNIELSAAVGYAEGEGRMIDYIIQQADAAMYQNKKNIK